MAESPGAVLIRNADIWGHCSSDVRIDADRITSVGCLEARPDENVIDAEGGALLPGLHDHHIHLAGLAARKASVWCGPPQVNNRDDLVDVLGSVGAGWIRAIGYHECVLGGLPSARELDRLVEDRPLRMQHRSGRMWLLNSRALDALLARAPPPPGLERDSTGFTGRLFDEDAWLRTALDSVPPDFAQISGELARFGVTGITDMSPHNDAGMAAHFAGELQRGALVQHCMIAGGLSLAEAPQRQWRLGPAKLHLHEASLPEFDDAVRFIDAARRQSRPVAVHCVSEVELVFALALLEQAGTRCGDRIEHASIASPELAARVAALGLWVCCQPHFVTERGDRYLADVEPRHRPDLYRLRSLATAAIPLAAGSDAPFGGADPWAAMAAAVSRRTAGGRTIGADEALDPDEALSLYLASPVDFRRRRVIGEGEPADLVLLDKPWREARQHLSSSLVALTVISGRIVHDRVDQSPVKGASRR